MALKRLADDDFLLVASESLLMAMSLPGVLTCMVSMISCTICAPCLSSMKSAFAQHGEQRGRELS